MAKCNNIIEMPDDSPVIMKGGELVCGCNYFLIHGQCRHTSAIKICKWSGEPILTVEGGRTKKVCPNCGGYVK
jgi:hypothetical protein